MHSKCLMWFSFLIEFYVFLIKDSLLNLKVLNKTLLIKIILGPMLIVQLSFQI